MNLKETYDHIKKNVSELGTSTPTSAKFLSGTGVWTSPADFSGLKSGTTQAGAGAAAGELWVDTDDDNTVKRGV